MSHGEFSERAVVVLNLSPAGKPDAHFGMGEGLRDLVHAFKAFADDELRELSHGQSGLGTRATGHIALNVDALCAAQYVELRRLS